MSFGVCLSSGAMAADMPVKAPVPVVGASVPLDVHGYVDLAFADTRVTPGGLMIYPTRGYLTQIDVGLSLDLYKNPTGFINGVSVFAGVWNEMWSSPAVGYGNSQELDWWAGFSVGFAQHWKFSAQYLELKFPGGATIHNYVYSLGFDDSYLGLPIAFNPYVNLFQSASGPSTVVLGNNGNTYRVELGIRPSVSMQKSTSIPLSFSFPTWVTVGPSSYWNRVTPATNLCGPTTSTPCALSNVGLFSTGIQARLGLDSIVPKQLGNWYLKAGVQYYAILNDALLGAQVATGAATSFPTAHKNVVVASGGIGFSF